MPSRSLKEHRFWEYIKHTPGAAAEHGIKPGVAEEFVSADKAAGTAHLPERVKPK